MDASFVVDSGNVYSFPLNENLNFGLGNNNYQMLDMKNVEGSDPSSYSVPNGQLYNNNQVLNSYQNGLLNYSDTDNMNQNMLKINDLGQTHLSVNGHLMNGADLNCTMFSSGFVNCSNSSYCSSDQFGKMDQLFNPVEQFGAYNISETSYVDSNNSVGEVNSFPNTPNYSYHTESFPQANYSNNTVDFVQNGVKNYEYPYYNSVYENPMNVTVQSVQRNDEWNVQMVNMGNYASENSDNGLKDDLESVANASTCEGTPILLPSPSPSNLPESKMANFNVNQSNVQDEMAPLNGYNMANDLSSTQLVDGRFYYPNYYPEYFNQTMNGYNMNEGYFLNDVLSDSVIEIANEIANNVQYLPNKDSNGKYSLDKNHPIHCVWRDVNRGHCSWRCRWWENGKRLSKNFNVKRFGEFEAMRMAITMKIRNSTPVERLQLLKEQREAVRNNIHLFNAFPFNYTPEHNGNDFKISKVVSDNKKLQKENWERLSWTYLKTDKLDSGDCTIVCRLCSKTTKCSRSRNLQQAHIMHLIRMHKNPWKQYINPNGLTKMCRLALDSLYQKNEFSGNEWNLRPGIQRPEPSFP